MTRVVAGIDAGKSKLDVHLERKDRTLPNARDGFRAIAKWFRAAKVERVVLVATSRMRRALVQFLHTKRFAISVVYVAARDMLRSGRIGLAFANLPQKQPIPPLSAAGRTGAPEVEARLWKTPGQPVETDSRAIARAIHAELDEWIRRCRSIAGCCNSTDRILCRTLALGR